jgi:hypothetical protein
MARFRSFASLAAGIAILLLCASSLCVADCVGPDHGLTPPCHRHAPSNTKACAHTALTASLRSVPIAVAQPASLGGAAVAAPILAAFPADPIPVPAVYSPPLPAVLRI